LRKKKVLKGQINSHLTTGSYPLYILNQDSSKLEHEMRSYASKKRISKDGHEINGGGGLVSIKRRHLYLLKVKKCRKGG